MEGDVIISTMNKDIVRELANDIMFDVTDEEAEDICNDFVTLEKMLNFFDSINTDGVEEMIYPFDDPTSFLREDKVDNNISQKEALINAPKQKQGHIVVPKVVK